MMMRPSPAAPPVLWLNLKGEILVAGQTVHPQINPGVSTNHIPEGIAYRFAGQKSGMLFGDMPALKLSGSITISTWINPSSYVTDGPGAEILFRGDDRDGYDPFYFVIEADGTINFSITDASNAGARVKAEIPLNRWTHVTANYNAETGELNMWLNGEQFAYSRSSHKPFVILDPAYTPGVGVGNVQNDRGPHNQPFRGMIADLRLYGAALTPDQTGFGGRTPGMPPPSEME